MNCGANIHESWKVCPECGTRVGEVKRSNLVQNQSKKDIKSAKFIGVSSSQNRMNSSRLIIGGIVFLIIITGVYIYFTRFYRERATPSLPSPLTAVPFPSEPIQYPADWPGDLKFPKEFVLVDSASGTLPESTAKGWSAKLRFQGKPSEAVTAISGFFEEKGWTIVENDRLDSGGFLLLLRHEQGEGIVIVDTEPSNSSHTLLIATLFPE
jgi:hypothetical protein